VAAALSTPAPDALAESLSAAKEAGLSYVSDSNPGIRRIRSGKGFRYVDAEGKGIRDQDTLARIRSLVIPPAWTDVWICPSPRGHLQATGRDARRRKQYRYHPRYRSQRDESKYEGLIEFAESLPRIRRRVHRDLRLRGLPKDRALATVVTFLDETSIRVGNAEYARDNNSFGATTLRNSHARVKVASIQLRFKGKSGRFQTLELNDRRLAAIVRRCHDLPGQELFQFIDECGEIHPVDSAMVHEYLRALLSGYKSNKIIGLPGQGKSDWESDG
jgi:DNA topoisomerase-1